MTEPLAYFTQRSDGTFVANDPARGPWSVDHCHAGPVTGLLARAVERAVPDKMLVRLTLDLVRPVPMAGVRVAAQIGHQGRSVATARAELHDLDGRLCASATSMHLARRALGEVPTAPIVALERSRATAGPPPLPVGVHDVPLFTDFVDLAYAEGSGPGLGPKTVWMRAPPLVDGEALSPIQTLCPLADCGNALSRNAEFGEMTFLNTDLTIHIHREPVSSWLASETLSHWQPDGIGLSQAILHDEKGPVAVALQSLLLRPARP